jgi:hypothetical protein
MRLRAFVLATLFLATVPALAEDEKKSDDEFETSWFGAKIEMWYQPHLSLHGTVVGGQQFTQAASLFTLNTEFNAETDLGVKTNTPKPTYLDFLGGPIILDGFVDTRWLSLEGFWITPFQYKGDTVLTRTFNFAGASFSVSEPVHTELAQSIMGVDIKFNVLNNRFIRVSPILAFRAIALDWSVSDGVHKASTEDIDFPLTFGRFKVFPYPEVGAEVRAGYRDFVEADLKVTGLYVNYVGVQAWTALVDVGVTGYVPFFPFVGLRLGYRYYLFEARTSDQQSDKQFKADLRISGAVASLIARF